MYSLHLSDCEVKQRRITDVSGNNAIMEIDDFVHMHTTDHFDEGKEEKNNQRQEIE